MRRRFVPAFALVALALLPAVARPADAVRKPTVVVRLASLDSLLADLRYLAELVGKDDDVKNFEGMLKAMTGEEGLKGINTKKPFGIYAQVGSGVADSRVVALVPVADEKKFAEVIGNILNIKLEKDKDGIYSVNLEKVPVPILAKIDSGYCYITNAKEALDKGEMLEPSAVLPAGKVGLGSITLQLDQISDDLKQLALGKIDNDFARAKEKPTRNATEAKVRDAILDTLSRKIKEVLRDGSALDFRVDVDRNSADVSMSLGVTAKPGSDLASQITELGSARSVAASLMSSSSALNGLLHASLPAKLRTALGPVLDDIEKKITDSAKPAEAREMVEVLVKALDPTLRAGEADAGVDLRGPSEEGLYTIVAGSRLKDGEGVDKAIRKVVAKLPAEAKSVIELDAEKAGSVAIHKITPPKVDEDTGKFLGSGSFYVAVREDAVLVAAGDKALEAIKEAATASPKTGRVFQIEAAIRQMAPLMEKDHKGAEAAAKKAFGKATGSDKVRFTIEGGDALKVRLSAKAQVLKFGSLMDENK